MNLKSPPLSLLIDQLIVGTGSSSQSRGCCQTLNPFSSPPQSAVRSDLSAPGSAPGSGPFTAWRLPFTRVSLSNYASVDNAKQWIKLKELGFLKQTADAFLIISYILLSGLCSASGGNRTFILQCAWFWDCRAAWEHLNQRSETRVPAARFLLIVSPQLRCVPLRSQLVQPLCVPPSDKTINKLIKTSKILPCSSSLTKQQLLSSSAPLLRNGASSLTRLLHFLCIGQSISCHIYI